MTDLFWPGDERAGSLMTPSAFLGAMVAVEDAWLAALVGAGIAPASAATSLGRLVGPDASDGPPSSDDVDALATAAEGGGNPVIPLLRLLRVRLADADGPSSSPARWLHRGLTSQDVVDTAMVLLAREVLDRLDVELTAQVAALSELAETHRATVMAGRTLTQHAVPITFGLKAAGWLTGVVTAAEGVRSARSDLAAQAGGAAGTLAALTQLAAEGGLADPPTVALDVVRGFAARLGLGARMPWHTSRGPVTRIGDALVTCTDAWGRIAGDVLTLSRPEIGELGEPAADGRGGSSTMPQKQNPVLSVLVRRAAIAAPGLAATLHTASSLSVDERPDGAWHVEWATLRTLSRHAAVAASQTTELLGGLRVDVGRMSATATREAHGLLAERRSITGPGAEADLDADPTTYLGVTDAVIDAARARAAAHLEARP